MRARQLPPAEPVGPMTFEQFIRFERAADFKHEFADGYAYPHADWVTGLAGAGRRHNDIVYELIRLIGNAAAGRLDWRVYGSDQQLYVAELDKAYYPDVQLVCDPTDQNEDYSQRPCLLIEVTSHNTARIDRGEKLQAYRRLPTLQAYWIVSQTERRISRWWRSPDQHAWLLDELTAGDIPLPCLATALTVDAIYARSSL
jgi:Uma2 family endonuclease